MSASQQVLLANRGEHGGNIKTVTRAYSASSVIIKGSASSTCTLTHAINGDLTIAGNDIGPVGTPNADEWHVRNPETGVGAKWDFKYTLTAGTTPNIGSLVAGTWYNLGTARDIGNTVANSSPQTITSTVTLDYALAGTTTSLKTVTGISVAAAVI